MNSLTFAALLLITFVFTFYLGYLFGREIEQESQDYARRIRNDYERKR
jgi:hypothetical protein